jgi:hypothetical protein
MGLEQVLCYALQQSNLLVESAKVFGGLNRCPSIIYLRLLDILQSVKIWYCELDY